MQVVLTGTIEVPENDLPKIIEALPLHIELTRSERGCKAFTVEQDSSAPTKFHVSERFENEEAFKNHQNRVLKSAWGTLSRNVKRHYEVIYEEDD